ncbi:MAG: methyltransferase domain-containing protein [Rhodospirillales bacterium]|nr:methyltransferase domain-containing protein [Alphaproteobacteria bacterium]MCB9986245.1 methyltransferase domain-containing protein [Rhodospirillales bacterium]USO07200.1 MAG: methyltransferase domain-containing protein [Rhodospirillales bacterium]
MASVSVNSDLSRLEAAIEKIAQVTDQQWQATLSERKKKELEFHDSHRDRAANAPAAAEGDTYEKFYGNKKYYTATDRSRQYVENWIKQNAPGAVFLDYACGDGMNAISAAKAGAKMAVGIDISPISVENARKDAQASGVSATTRFVQADCENTLLPDNSVDVVICSGMLHHLDLSYAFPELRRIMKPGAKLLAVEALDYNPMIKLYRMMTPQMRTEWEKAHILSHKDLRFARRFFEVGQVKYWHILGIATPHLPRPLAALAHSLDKLLEKTPLMQMMAWIFTFELTKPKAS